MLSSVKLSPESIETSREMGHILGQGRTLDAVKEKLPLPWKEKSIFYQDRHKVRHSFAEPSLDPNSELRQNASTKKVVQSKPSERNERRYRPGHRTCDDDELVKHMSNLPGFLQRVEKESSIQEKALNFGVLDWKRLEKWKYTERMPGKYPKKTSPSRSSCSASGPPKMVPNLRKQPSSHGLNPSSLYSGKQPLPHGSRFSSPQRQPTLPSLVNSSKEARNASYCKIEKCDEPIKSKEKETCDQESQTAECRTIGRQQEHFPQAVKFNSVRKDAKKKTTSENKASPSEGSKHNRSLSSHNKTNAQGKKSEIRFNNEVKSTSESCTADPQNIVLLVPKHFSRKSCSESSQLTESRTSLDGQLAEVAGNRLSDLFSSQELYSGELSADIPHSCPLPSGATVDCAMELHNSVTSQAVDTDICASACPSANPVTSITFEGKRSMMHDETAWSSSLVEASSKTQADVAEQPTVQGRAPSPARRFSFNLGRMSRSFSFKESSAVPQLSSTYTSVKSGPVRPEVSSGMDHSEREKASASRRSSPLRRLLDPLLRNKGAQSSENVGAPNGGLRSMTVRTTATKGPYQDRKPEASSFQALLQLTLKNGLPFFKLVVDNSNDMLAATVKKLPTSEKSDPCMIFSFYSVHEIRKKSMNWISQGSKGKSCSLGYNIVGQMHISNSNHLKENAGDFSECSRECVLYGVDPGQVDKQTLEFAANKEIAAIIVKNSSKKLNDGVLSDDHQMNKEREYLPGTTFYTGESKNSNGIVAILPGGVHGLPIKGAPSSLISRWRSGGSCDCGGWDVGCKLRILADHKNSSNILQASMSSAAVDHVNLFIQGGKQKSSKPVFTLEPFSNGFYSIGLDASVSLLEAFAICVAHVTCWKFPELIDSNGPSDAENLPEANIGADKRKPASTFQEQVPAKYITCPPLSPVGRI
ncbi:hypothetical protein Salat_2312700 [Sesamum alatum]|uniref:Uncharacterized protein n=1 Tax=Sesamum alatum TaxID=300844 RepID=A0AAE2CEA8_9LAMI|nr:hypothetical protein Salat_2312700 [Sesamum alatum]